MLLPLPLMVGALCGGAPWGLEESFQVQLFLLAGALPVVWGFTATGESGLLWLRFLEAGILWGITAPFLSLAWSFAALPPEIVPLPGPLTTL